MRQAGASSHAPRDKQMSAQGLRERQGSRNMCRTLVACDCTTALGGTMKFPHRRQFLSLAAGVAALPALSRVARAQAYPTRPVHMILPLTAGSAADILARRLATKMAENWGQPVVV